METESKDDEWFPRSDEEIGERLHQELAEAYGLESEAWALERIERVTARLNAVRLACPVKGVCPHPLRTEILWLGEMNAFAAPGRWVYITRALLQRTASDDPVALVIAHEMAHHDLGHLRVLTSSLAGELMRRLPARAKGSQEAVTITAVTTLAMWKLLQGKLQSVERETSADAYAMDLCLAAGYAPLRCLELFDILEAYLLDFRDLNGVYGSDREAAGVEYEGSSLGRAWNTLNETWERRSKGYPSLRARRAALIAQLRAA